MSALDGFLKECSEKDANAEIPSHQNEFHVPVKDGVKQTYMCVHSLGVQHKDVEKEIAAYLEKWRTNGVSGHWTDPDPWFRFEDTFCDSMAAILGCGKNEVTIMNTLTSNIHSILQVFYRSRAVVSANVKTARTKILMTNDEFPSDALAIRSFVGSTLGLNTTAAKEHVLTADSNTDALIAAVKEAGESLGAVWVSAVAYRSAELLDLKRLAEAAHSVGAFMLVDFAHASGAVPLKAAEWGCDAGVFCSYKHLSCGPGNLGGVYLHKRHHALVAANGEGDMPSSDSSLPTLPTGQALALRGWWSASAATRFVSEEQFEAAPGAAALAMSNPPVVGLVCMRPSINLIAKVGVESIHKRSTELGNTVLAAIDSGVIPSGVLQYDGPKDHAWRGGHLLLRVLRAPEGVETDEQDAASKASGFGGILKAALLAKGVVVDERKPHHLRVGTNGLYNTHADMGAFVKAVCEIYAQ